MPNKRYTPEFKRMVIETMMEEELSYRETARRFEINDRTRITDWERITWRKVQRAWQLSVVAGAAGVNRRNCRKMWKKTC
ncbi:MAG: transposase [Clostridia bacterium]